MKPSGLSRFLLLAATLSLLAAVGQTVALFSFLNHSYRVEATVIQGTVHRGPPPLPGTIPLHVTFQSLDGVTRRANARSPFLRHFEPGDKVPLLVREDDVNDVRLPYWANLLTAPVGLFLGAVALVILRMMVTRVRA